MFVVEKLTHTALRIRGRTDKKEFATRHMPVLLSAGAF